MIDADTRRKAAQVLDDLSASQKNAMLYETVRDTMAKMTPQELKRFEDALLPLTDSEARNMRMGLDGAATLILQLALNGVFDDR